MSLAGSLEIEFLKSNLQKFCAEQTKLRRSEKIFLAWYKRGRKIDP